MKRKLLLLMSLMVIGLTSPLLACDVCKSQQPKVVQNITHGAGPQGQTDFIIIAIAIAVVLVTLIFSIKYLLKPGEDSPGHVKRIVLENY
jgi:uncharacterized protein HemY